MYRLHRNRKGEIFQFWLFVALNICFLKRLAINPIKAPINPLAIGRIINLASKLNSPNFQM